MIILYNIYNAHTNKSAEIQQTAINQVVIVEELETEVSNSIFLIG